MAFLEPENSLSVVLLLLLLLQDLLPLPRLEELLCLLHPVYNKHDKTPQLRTSKLFILKLQTIFNGLLIQLMLETTIFGSSP